MLPPGSLSTGCFSAFSVTAEQPGIIRSTLMLRWPGLNGQGGGQGCCCIDRREPRSSYATPLDLANGGQCSSRFHGLVGRDEQGIEGTVVALCPDCYSP
jgi:hypothetical protein